MKFLKQIFKIIIIFSIFIIITSLKNSDFNKFYNFKKITNLDNTLFIYKGFDKQNNIEMYYIKKVDNDKTLIESINIIPEKSLIITEIVIDNKTLMMKKYETNVYSLSYNNDNNTNNNENRENANNNNKNNNKNNNNNNINHNKISDNIRYNFKLTNFIDKKNVKGMYTSFVEKDPSKKERPIDFKYKEIPSFLYPFNPDMWYSFFFFNTDIKKIKIGNIYFFMYAKAYLHKLNKSKFLINISDDFKKIDSDIYSNIYNDNNDNNNNNTNNNKKNNNYKNANNEDNKNNNNINIEKNKSDKDILKIFLHNLKDFKLSEDENNFINLINIIVSNEYSINDKTLNYFNKSLYNGILKFNQIINDNYILNNKDLNNNNTFYTNLLPQLKTNFQLQASGLYQIYIPELNFTLLKFKYPLLYKWEMTSKKEGLHKKLIGIFKISNKLWEYLKSIK